MLALYLTLNERLHITVQGSHNIFNKIASTLRAIIELLKKFNMKNMINTYLFLRLC